MSDVLLATGEGGMVVVVVAVRGILSAESVEDDPTSVMGNESRLCFSDCRVTSWFHRARICCDERSLEKANPIR